ncbi:MAG: multiheme c-type cytochrome [Betaproteobacteria bacterium]|nr:multiheme c-type cytochrome [Betaproteobacteria bacterium]
MRPRWLLIPVLLSLAGIAAGMAWVDWSKGGAGSGLYSREWQPDPVQGYWDPERFYKPAKTVEGSYPAAECIACHEALTPGIVADWRDSRHSKPASRAPVACPDCHGADHQNLRMPTPQVCAGCHGAQHEAFQSEKQYGFPSHALAMERATDSKHFVDKPKAETTACVQCHSVATKCDSCHTRHRFDAAEARRAEACTTCHSGPPHPDDETYYASAHGKRYLADAATTDWSKPLKKGNYATPTCAYCHMRNGRHVVADKSIWQFGLRQVNPNSAENKVKRERWVEVCTDCHDAEFSRRQLAEMDRERVQAWQGLNRTERLLRALRSEKALYPAAGERPPYPTDWMDAIFPKERIGFFEGQASSFYNVSTIERDYFEMWYFANLGSYKAAAHGAPERVKQGHAALAQAEKSIAEQAAQLRAKARDPRPDPKALWLGGEYTVHNKEHN